MTSSWAPSLEPIDAELHEANRPVDIIIKAAQALRPIARYRPGLPSRTIIPAIPTVDFGSQIIRDDPFTRRGYLAVVYDRNNCWCRSAVNHFIALISEHTAVRLSVDIGAEFFLSGFARRALRIDVTLRIDNGGRRLATKRVLPIDPQKRASGKTNGQRLVLAVRGISASKQTFDECERTR
jgi:hypothetical protein